MGADAGAGWLRRSAAGRALDAFAIAPVRRMLFLGFAAGLPLNLVFGTLSFRLREAGVDLATIGFASWVTLAYGLKWSWAPLVDHVHWPWLTRRLGQRRSWLLAAQLAVIVGVLSMARRDAATELVALVASALFTAFAAATQDVALDAYRIESAPPSQQGPLAAAYQVGYRLATLWAGAGALWLAASADATNGGDHAASWNVAYSAMAASMLIGIVAVLRSPDAGGDAASREPVGFRPRLRAAVYEPLADFVRRYRWRALLLLALISTFRLPDIVMGVMANPFYSDLGFSKLEVANVSKLFGVAMTIVGALAGGAAVPRFGVLPTLFAGAIGASVSGVLFALLAQRGHDTAWLALAVSVDNLATGIAGSAFITFLSNLTNLRYSATQYALFSSMMLLLPKYLAGFGGVYVHRFGYPAFFCTAALIGLPAWLLIGLVARLGHVPDGRSEPPDGPQGSGGKI